MNTDNVCKEFEKNWKLFYTSISKNKIKYGSYKIEMETPALLLRYKQ